MNAVAALVLLATALAATDAHAQKVSTNYDKSVDFSRFKTYFLIAGKEQAPTPIVPALIASGLDSALQAKGWTRAEKGEGDVAVVYNVARNSTVKSDTTYSGYGYVGGWGYSGLTGSTSSARYTEGSLIIELFEASSKQLIWRGTASGALSDKLEKNEKKLSDSIEKMFKKFPPPPPKK